MDWMTWYNGLAKPTWTPSPSTIGLIWQILYPIILVSFGFVFVQAIRRKSAAGSWHCRSPSTSWRTCSSCRSSSGLRNMPLAALDILIVWGTILWMIVAVWKHYRWVAVAQVPYLIWVSIATVLQLSITWMNWR